MKILAFDVGKNTGVCFLENSKMIIDEIKFKTLFQYKEEIKELIKKHKPNLVVYSDTVFMKNSNSVKPLHFYMACVEMACEELKTQYEAIQDSTAKKHVIGKGNAKKHEIKEWVINTSIIESDGISQDVCDATMFAEYMFNKLNKNA